MFKLLKNQLCSNIKATMLAILLCGSSTVHSALLDIDSIADTALSMEVYSSNSVQDKSSIRYPDCLRPHFQGAIKILGFWKNAVKFLDSQAPVQYTTSLVNACISWAAASIKGFNQGIVGRDVLEQQLADVLTLFYGRVGVLNPAMVSQVYLNPCQVKDLQYPVSQMMKQLHKLNGLLAQIEALSVQ